MGLTCIAALHGWQPDRPWRMLSTNFANGHHFLRTWAAWRADAGRSPMLHYTAIVSPDTVHDGLVLPDDSELHALAQLLQAQLYGLLPGVHRITLEAGRVLLTLWIGDVHTQLR
ncbi:MAG: FAD-dependent cmnm(5)s(2)U34 oxidoreductase, partial [Comamonas sp.]